MMDRIFSWDTLWYFFLVLYVLACPFLITIVLLQKGKGTGFAGSFGAGGGPGSETVFGPRAGQTLPVRMTYIAAGIFVFISLSMSMIATYVGRGRAPELVDGAAGGAAPASSTGLEDLGIGGGRQGAGGAAAAAPAAAAAAPATSAAPSTSAPAAPAPSTPAPANP